MLDLTPWLEPLAGDNPSGESLRDDPAFLEVERLMTPRKDVARDALNRPSREIEIPVDWTEVLARCEALRARGRDLRLVVVAVRALANTDGLAGLATGLTLVARTIELHWDTLYPELRPTSTPAEGAMRRLNVLAGLHAGASPVGDLRTRAIVSVRGYDPVTGEDLERATLDPAVVLQRFRGLSAETRAKEIGKQEELILRVRTVLGALAKQAPDQLAAEVAGAKAALAATAAIEDALAARIGPGPRLGDLTRFLELVAATLLRSETEPAAETAAEPETETEIATETGAAPAGDGRALAEIAAPAARPVALAEIRTRQDVVRMLERIIEFYDRTEPSSPVPFLARRMVRMVPMDFLQLVEEMAPGGAKEFRTVAGISDDSKKARN